MFPFLMKTSYDEKSGRKQVPTLQKFFQTILDLFVKMMRRFIFPGKIIKVILDYKENS